MGIYWGFLRIYWGFLYMSSPKNEMNMLNWIYWVENKHVTGDALGCWGFFVGIGLGFLLRLCSWGSDRISE